MNIEQIAKKRIRIEPIVRPIGPKPDIGRKGNFPMWRVSDYARRIQILDTNLEHALEKLMEKLDEVAA